MAKNKKKKAQMFRNFLAFKAGQPNQQANQLSSFQTPHSEQEKLTELIDDNVGGGPSQPNVNKPMSSGTNNPSPQPQISRWTALKPVDEANIQVNMRHDKTRPNLTIVEGSASKIQLIIDKSKKMTTQPNNSPKAEEPSLNTPPVPSPQPNQQRTQVNKTQPTNSYIPQQAYLPAQLTQVTKTYPEQRPPAPLSYPAGIPRSTVFLADTNKLPAGVPKPAMAFFREENILPSPQINPITEQTDGQANPRLANWASHHKPVWTPTAAPPMPIKPNTGSGWPKSRSVPVKYENCRIPQRVNDITVQVDNITQVVNPLPPQAYSPSDVYSEGFNNDENYSGATDEESESPEILQSGSKRLSAFQRLGPLAEQPKKPKLTINLLCQKDVRNVVDETDDVPTHLRDYITSSSDDIVVKYLDMWPFKKSIVPARTATARQSKSVMILETEYMEEAYTKDNRFILVSVTGYPPHWRKEDVLDAVLESVKAKTLIPCFIEFSRVQCRFLVIRCRPALLAIHKYGFIIHKGDVELIVSLSNIHLNLNQLDFVPRLVLRKMLSARVDGSSCDLSHFTTKNDVSHFIYFPLCRVINQTELMQLQSSVPWETLTSLNLSHNRITSVTGLNFVQTTPKLQHLDLSYNCIEKATVLLPSRNLPLKTLRLEGNPLCNDYIEQEHYIKVLTMMFTGLEEIDGVPIRNKHILPESKRNYCPEEAKHIVEKLLEIMFPLLDASRDQRFLLEDLYEEEAVLTITFMYKLRYGAVYKDYRNLFNRARVMDEGDLESIVGAAAIVKVSSRWPEMMHDPTTFTVDVLYHTDFTTIVRISGIVKITTESLADEEHILSFTRTIVLHTKDGSEYKISNEMLYWDLPEKAYAETAFQITRVKPKGLISLRLDAPPNEELKEKLLNVFMQLTELKKQPSERCLELKGWNIKSALEYFTKLLKLDNLYPIMRDNIN